MGTKQNPSKFDCAAVALDDEPQFTLLARDPDFAMLVRLWAVRRAAQVETGDRPLADAMQVAEAIRCADEGERWRRDNEKEKPWRNLAPSPVEDEDPGRPTFRYPSEDEALQAASEEYHPVVGADPSTPTLRSEGPWVGELIMRHLGGNRWTPPLLINPPPFRMTPEIMGNRATYLVITEKGQQYALRSDGGTGASWVLYKEPKSPEEQAADPEVSSVPARVTPYPARRSEATKAAIQFAEDHKAPPAAAPTPENPHGRLLPYAPSAAFMKAPGEILDFFVRLDGRPGRRGWWQLSDQKRDWIERRDIPVRSFPAGKQTETWSSREAARLLFFAHRRLRTLGWEFVADARSILTAYSPPPSRIYLIDPQMEQPHLYYHCDAGGVNEWDPAAAQRRVAPILWRDSSDDEEKM